MAKTFFSTSNRARKARILKIDSGLAKAYPDAHCELNIKGPLQTLIATILSAQCTDAKVNTVVPELFAKYKTPADYASAKLKDIEKIIKPLGLYHAKASNIIKCCQQIEQDFGGKVPNSMEKLTKLAGVGRKTASCVLVNAYDKPGLMTDTHFCRITQRLGLTENSEPVKIEQDIAEILPDKKWGDFSHRIIIHGRRCCAARKPECDRCPIAQHCEFFRSRAKTP